MNWVSIPSVFVLYCLRGRVHTPDHRSGEGPQLYPCSYMGCWVTTPTTHSEFLLTLEVKSKKKRTIYWYVWSAFQFPLYLFVLSPAENKLSRTQVRGSPSIVSQLLHVILGNYLHYTLWVPINCRGYLLTHTGMKWVSITFALSYPRRKPQHTTDHRLGGSVNYIRNKGVLMGQIYKHGHNRRVDSIGQEPLQTYDRRERAQRIIQSMHALEKFSTRGKFNGRVGNQTPDLLISRQWRYHILLPL